MNKVFCAKEGNESYDFCLFEARGTPLPKRTLS